MDLAAIIELDRLAREEGGQYPKKRFLFDQIHSIEGKHFTGIVGPRGAGKTILLKQLASEHKKSIYISLDTTKEDLFEIVKKLHQDFKIELFLLDEVHFHANFDEELKKIYDFLQVKIIFTSSVSLLLFDSAYDLSRRVQLKKLYPLSFREYIFFKQGVLLKALSFRDVIEKKWDEDVLRYASMFDQYLQGGILPFALNEPEALALLKNVTSAVIMKDIPRVARVTIDELETIERMLVFMGRSSVENINYSTLARNLGITVYKAQQYTGLLEKAFIVHQIFPKGTNVLKEPKILMAVPYRLLFLDFDQAIGGLREDFFAEMLKSLGVDFYYLKSTRGEKTPDFLLSLKDKDIVIEIGGKGKGRRQFKGIRDMEKVILTHSLECDGWRRPLFLLGLIDRIE